MSLVSGVCSALDAKFNLWDSVEPYAAQLLRDERGNVVQDLARDALGVLGTAWRLPRRIDAALTRLEEGAVEVRNPSLERKVQSLERAIRRVGAGVLFAGMLIAGAVLRPDDQVFGNLLMFGALVPLLAALWGGRREL
jgi:predicted unusual protein kinase regulating ubiquinone biosynthesis (AarF/ABC1/UbiB family)